MLGCDGERVYYDGTSCIYLNGEPLAQGAQFSLNEVVRFLPHPVRLGLTELLLSMVQLQVMVSAQVDLEDVRSYRNFFKSRCVMAARSPSYPRMTVDFSLSQDSLRLPVSLGRYEYQLLSANEEIRYTLPTV